jgi:hypothetical protein
MRGTWPSLLPANPLTALRGPSYADPSVSVLCSRVGSSDAAIERPQGFRIARHNGPLSSRPRGIPPDVRGYAAKYSRDALIVNERFAA